MKIVVCILSDDPKDERLQKRLYQGLFLNDLFINKACNIQPPKYDLDLTNFESKNNVFNYRINWCLRETAAKNPNDYVMIVNDDVISAMQSHSLASVCQEVINLNGREDKDETIGKNKWDICYLNAWGDDVSNYKHLADITSLNMYVSTTDGPSGSSAFIISPSYRNRLLENPVSKPDRSVIILPNPFYVDPYSRDDDKEVFKLNLQRSLGDRAAKSLAKQEINSISFLWFFGIVAFSILIAFILIKFK